MREIIRPGAGGTLLYRPLVLGLIVAAVMFLGAGPAQAKSIFDDDTPSAPNPVPSRPGAPPGAPATSAPTSPTAPAPSGPALVPPALPPDAFTPNGVTNIVPGLIARFYDGQDFTRIKEARIVKRVRITVNINGVGEAPFCFSWTGLLNIPAGGLNASYQMAVRGPYEVAIDGNVVATHATQYPVTLTEGIHTLAIKVSHLNSLGGKSQIVSLNWTPAGEGTQVVPFTVFSHYKKDEPPDLTTTPLTNTSPTPIAIARAPQGVPVAPALPPALPPPAVQKGETPAPSATRLAELHKNIRAKFATYYAHSGLVVRQSLVMKLTDAADTAPDPAERYALLKEASDQAAACGDLKTALALDDTLAGTFKVQELEIKLATLAQVSRVKNASVSGHDLGAAAMELSDHANDAGNYDLALKAAQLADSAYTAAHDDDAARSKARIKDVRELTAQSGRIAPLLKKLNETPDDPDANLKVGRFYCFTVGNFEKGLPLVAKGTDIALKALAEQEAAPPADADTQIKLGDAWWDKATGESASAASKCKERGCYWYDKARAQGKEELPARLLLRLATLSRTIDLLPRVDINQTSVVNGVPYADPDPPRWTRARGILLYNVSRRRGTLQLPYRPAGEYDFSVEFSPANGSPTIGMLMPVQGKTLEWMMSSAYTNFATNLRRGALGPISRGNVPIVNGRRYMCTVQIRHNGARALINGTVIREWQTDYSDLSGGFGANLSDTRCLGLTCAGADVAITGLRVTEIPGDAR